MSITNKVFLDSSFFTEGYKGNHLDFYKFFNLSPAVECCINAVVCSEHWYNLMGLMSSASPLAIKQKNSIGSIVANGLPRFEFFRDFTILTVDSEVVELAMKFIPKHNMLSNDALILASCVVHQIPYIASHDSDFEAACQSEGIQLVTPANYEELFTK